MIYQETTRTRRIVGRLDRGDDCVDRLTEFCREHDLRAGRIDATGQLSAVEFVRFDSGTGDYEEVFEGEGDFDLVDLSGHISTLGERPIVRLQALVTAGGPVAPQVIAGQLRSATAVEFEFVLEVFEDLELERQLDDETGMLTLHSIRRTSPVESDEPDDSTVEMEGQSMAWDEAAEDLDDDSEPAAETDSGAAEPSEAEADETEEESSTLEDLDEPMLESGDIIDHPKLGRCRVIKLEEGKYAHIRLPKGKIRKLSLNVVDIEYSGEENGRNVFEAQVSP